MWALPAHLEKESSTSCPHLRCPGRTPDAPRGFCWWILPRIRQPELEEVDQLTPGGKDTVGRAESQAERGLHLVTGTGASRDCALLRCTAGCACAVLCDSAFSLPGRRRRRRPPRHRWQRCAALEPAPLPLPAAGSLCMPSLHTELLFILQSPLSTATASGRPFLLLLTRLCVLRGMARSPVPPTYPAPGPSLGSLPLQRLQKSDICFPSLPCSYEWSQDMVLANEAQG